MGASESQEDSLSRMNVDYAVKVGVAHKEWAVIDGDSFEQWPTEQIARDELRHFYSDDARLVSRVVTEWEDAG